MQETQVTTSDTNTRRYTSKKERQSHVENWKKSGLSMSEYCRQNNLNLASLSEWKRALQNPVPPKFKQVKLLPAALSLPNKAIESNNIIEVIIDERIELRVPVSEISLLVNIIKGITCN